MIPNENSKKKLLLEAVQQLENAHLIEDLLRMLNVEFEESNYETTAEEKIAINKGLNDFAEGRV